MESDEDEIRAKVKKSCDVVVAMEGKLETLQAATSQQKQVSFITGCHQSTKTGKLHNRLPDSFLKVVLSLHISL